MTPMFFINEISYWATTNKAQEYVASQIDGLSYRTIDSKKDLLKFEQYLQKIAKEANTKFPRCKPIEIHEMELLNGVGYNFSIRTTNNKDIASFTVYKIIGNWEEIKR